MDFKKILSGVFMLGLVQCKVGSVPKASGGQNIGDSIERLIPKTTQASENDREIFVFDQHVGRIHTIDLESMGLVASYKARRLNIIDHNYVLSGENQDYVIHASSSFIDLIYDDGTRVDDVVKMPGSPSSVAANPSEGNYVLLDDLSSLAIVKIPESKGEPRSLVTGTKISETETILAGDLFTGGQLLVSFKEKGLARIDLEACFSARKLVARTLKGPDDIIDWIAPIPDQAKWAFLKSEKKAYLYDMGEEEVLSEFDLSSYEELGRFKKFDPHFYLRARTSSENALGVGRWLATASATKILSINDAGEFVLTSTLFTFGGLLDSIYSKDTSIVTLVGDTYAYRLRLSDNFVIGTKTFDQGLLPGILDDHLVLQYDSALGLLEKVKIDNEKASSATQLKGFNVPFLLKD